MLAVQANHSYGILLLVPGSLLLLPRKMPTLLPAHKNHTVRRDIRQTRSDAPGTVGSPSRGLASEG